MSRKTLFVRMAGVLLAALLLSAAPALAGEHVRAGHPVVVVAKPVVAPVAVVAAPVTIRIALTPDTEPATDAAYIKLRGPNGEVRRFAVEGGPESLASRIVVLRPGESITLHLGTK